MEVKVTVVATPFSGAQAFPDNYCRRHLSLLLQQGGCRRNGVVIKPLPCDIVVLLLSIKNIFLKLILALMPKILKDCEIFKFEAFVLHVILD